MEKDKIEQINFYKENGYFLFHNAFDKKSIQNLKEDLKSHDIRNREEFVFEEDGITPNAIWDVHNIFNSFKDISHSDFILNTAKAFIQNEQIYIHQSKVNFKPAFIGRDVKWHQDFTFWFHLDGMQKPEALTAAIFLDDIKLYNAPLLIIPKTHKTNYKSGIIRDTEISQHKEGKNHNIIPELTYEIEEKTLKNLADKHDIMSIYGNMGSVCFFHSNVVHGSSNNISPYSRNILFITYNSANNKLKNINKQRAHYIASRKYKIL